MAMIKSVHVRLFTEDDDKDPEESVTTKIVYGDDRVLAQHARGAGQLWPDHSEQAFGMNLDPTVAEQDSGRMKVVVEKSCHGSDTGCGWNMSISVTGQTDDGRTLNLLGRTTACRMGDNNPVAREWSFR